MPLFIDYCACGHWLFLDFLLWGLWEGGGIFGSGAHVQEFLRDICQAVDGQVTGSETIYRLIRTLETRKTYFLSLRPEV